MHSKIKCDLKTRLSISRIKDNFWALRVTLRLSNSGFGSLFTSHSLIIYFPHFYLSSNFISNSIYSLLFSTTLYSLLLFFVWKASPDQVIAYPPKTNANGLQSSQLGLLLLATPNLFNRGLLSLKCTATMTLVYEFEAVEYVIAGSARNKSHSWRKGEHPYDNCLCLLSDYHTLAINRYQTFDYNSLGSVSTPFSVLM